MVIIEHLSSHVQNPLHATIKAPSLARQLLLSDLLVYLLVLTNNFFLTWASSLDIVFNSGAFAYSSSNMLRRKIIKTGEVKRHSEESINRLCLYFENSPSSVLRKLLIIQEQTRVSMGFVSKLKQCPLQGHFETFFSFSRCHI